jgi:hypothetical protein
MRNGAEPAGPLTLAARVAVGCSSAGGTRTYSRHAGRRSGPLTRRAFGSGSSALLPSGGRGEKCYSLSTTCLAALGAAFAAGGSSASSAAGAGAALGGAFAISFGA